MIALLQRVSSASVTVSGERIASILSGLLVFVGVERDDDSDKAERLATRVLTYRVFPDVNGKMNLSVQNTNGALLLVPQFTLAADTDNGSRASFTPAAEPDTASRLFDQLASHMRSRGATVECGQFGAEMSVALVNEGPVTFWLQV